VGRAVGGHAVDGQVVAIEGKLRDQQQQRRRQERDADNIIETAR
jgi:hypothetical protein